jgi:hypothetical protein
LKNITLPTNFEKLSELTIIKIILKYLYIYIFNFLINIQLNWIYLYRDMPDLFIENPNLIRTQTLSKLTNLESIVLSLR